LRVATTIAGRLTRVGGPVPGTGLLPFCPSPPMPVVPGSVRRTNHAET
jgi:hypothetical protein